jgi:D-glycero-alpha-D-manno-heptose-7-phosphate kinase
VLDAGGWTDTWFAGHGSVCHLAVGPGAEVLARRRPLRKGDVATVQLHLPAFDDHYQFPLDQAPGRHRMLQDLGGSKPRSGHVAQCAHEVETVDLALQSGVQDQVAAAFGGANFVTIAPYPHFEVRPLEVKPGTWADLCRRVLTVYLGERHDSSAIHTSVIDRLSGAGPGTGAVAGNGHGTRGGTAAGGGSAGIGDGTMATAETLMAPLRAAADQAATALVNGDLDAYGEAMIANTEAQSALHPALVSPMARQVIDLARQNGAAGWKVNGAGGDGGTVSVLGPEDPDELQRVLATVESLTVLDLQPSPEGVRVVDEN